MIKPIRHEQIKNGAYSFLIEVSNTAIFAFLSGYTEVVSESYEFKSQHAVVIDFFVMPNGMSLEVDKPVIYLYSDSVEQVTLELEFPGELTFTYPLYEDVWDVTVEGNELTEKRTGRSYPYLFWEGELEELQFKTEEDQIPGAWVSREEVIPFLEEALENLGLNSSEKADFITFWGPRMCVYDHVFAQFLVDSEYDALIGETKTSENVESKRSVYLLFAGTNTDMGAAIKGHSQFFNGFQRKGVTLLEWGGSELPLSALIQLEKNIF